MNVILFALLKSHIDRNRKLKYVYKALGKTYLQLWIKERCDWVYASCWAQESPRALSAEMQALRRVTSSLDLSYGLWAKGAETCVEPMLVQP